MKCVCAENGAFDAPREWLVSMVTYKKASDPDTMVRWSINVQSDDTQKKVSKVPTALFVLGLYI
jgi:hypothetical protein